MPATTTAQTTISGSHEPITRNTLATNAHIAFCGRPGCDGGAAGHLRIVAEITDNMIIADLPYSILHIDLCPDHVAEARQKYRLIDEFHLNMCPTCHY